MKDDDVSQYNLYHGMRSKKTQEQIKKEGFCSYGTVVDEKRNIINALRYFGKEKLIATKGRKGDIVRDAIREISGEGRRNTRATADKDAPCKWWSSANPEHISLTLHQVGVEPEKIDKYPREKFGNNCYNAKLKITSRGQSANFNTGINCIPPSLIDSIETCKQCKYTGQEHKE